MTTIKQIINHLLHGLVQLAELFDRSITALVRELDIEKDQSDKKDAK